MENNVLQMMDQIMRENWSKWEDEGRERGLSHEGMQKIHAMARSLEQLTGAMAEVSIYYGFDTAGIRLEMEELTLPGEEKDTLQRLLAQCASFEVLPLRWGGVRVGVTIKGVIDRTGDN